MPADLTPGLSLFVGGFVAALCAFAAALAWSAAPGEPVVRGLAVGLLAVGGAFLLIALGVAAMLYRRGDG